MVADTTIDVMTVKVYSQWAVS